MIQVNLINETDKTIKTNIFDTLISETQKEIPNKTNKFNKNGEINVIIVDDTKIHEINLKYRHKDKPTDVISFAYLESEITKGIATVIGDIFISIDTAKIQAKKNSHSLTKEIAVLTTHGFLHLFGFDHQNDEQENEMELHAKKILSSDKLSKHF
jgi:probable rRNA maturation factor